MSSALHHQHVQHNWIKSPWCNKLYFACVLGDNSDHLQPVCNRIHLCEKIKNLLLPQRFFHEQQELFQIDSCGIMKTISIYNYCFQFSAMKFKQPTSLSGSRSYSHITTFTVACHNANVTTLPNSHKHTLASNNKTKSSLQFSSLVVTWVCIHANMNHYWQLCAEDVSITFSTQDSLYSRM
jgi:hypothetical protein